MMRIHEFDQGSPEWIAARMGIPTASKFHTVMLKEGREKGKPAKTRTEYLYRLAGERITHEPSDTFRSFDMERGQYMEAEARDFYAFTNNIEPRRVGFVTNHGAGCSPDSLIGDVGMLEIKTAAPHILIGRLLCDDFPPEHRAQCQGNLWVAEREWIDCLVYWPGMPPVVRRAERDEAFIKDLAAAVDQFNAELAELVERVRRYGMQEAAPDNVLMAG
jgi:hypothetical protein